METDLESRLEAKIDGIAAQQSDIVQKIDGIATQQSDMATVQASILTRLDNLTSPQAGYASAAKTLAVGIAITAVLSALKPILFAYFVPQ